MDSGSSGEESERDEGSLGEETKSILVVEDEESVAALYTQILSDDYDVEVANNGGEALMKFGDHTDVVLLDRRLPGTSGDEILEQLKSKDNDCHIAMVSSIEPDFDVIEMGFDDYLVKPVENTELERTVERLLTLDEYQELYQELSAKLVKKNIVEVEKADAQLDESDEYQALLDRIDELESQLETIESNREFDDRLLPS